MASTAPAQDAVVLLTWENAGNVVEGSLGVLDSQRSDGGFTVYRIVFKVCHERPLRPCAYVTVSMSSLLPQPSTGVVAKS